jgi:hypothetical protein
MASLKQKIIEGVAAVGLGIGSLVSGGCMVTGTPDQMFGREQKQRQWVEIDGRLGFVNPQGYGIVPNPADGGKTNYVYEYRGGRWLPMTHPAKSVDYFDGTIYFK